jgi:CRP/FNR family cyclic AMP-dependent transcriptional regulator
MGRSGQTRHARGVAAPALDPIGTRERPTVCVVDEDASLLEVADLGARRQLVARALSLRTGAWTPFGGDMPRDFEGWLGLLVLDGLLVRETQVSGLQCAELLGPGDLLRPWDTTGLEATLVTAASWRVLEPARIALLDAGFARRAARWPELGAELMSRTLARSRSLSILLALTQARRADVRLRTLFSHLADRWGRVTPDGIVLPLNLTHSVIAQLTGLRRPTVSLTLADLERSGEIVRRSRDCWLLSH